MKIILFSFLMFSSWAYSSSTAVERDHYINRGKYELPPEIYDVTELNKVLFNDLARESKDLKKAKYYLLNGKTKEAELHLSKMAYSHSKLKPIIHRYLGTLSFIQGRYEKSQIYLSLPELMHFPHHAKVCTLQVLNQIVLNQVNNLTRNWEQCQLSNVSEFKRRNVVWLDTLVKIKTDTSEDVTKVPFQKVRLDSLFLRDLKILLKLAIYLNQDKMLLPGLELIQGEELKDQELREIIGHIYYRNGELVNAYRFIEDLKTPNAETMKGNLYVLRGKYELAYAQFKLALEMKHNSQNAIERLLPLAWILGDWKQGSVYAENLSADLRQKAQKLTLLTAFMVQRGEFEKAEEILYHISRQTGQGTHIDVTQLHAFTKLMRSKPVEFAREAKMSCSQYDLVSCWLLFQNEHWQDFPFVVRRRGTIEHTQKWKDLLSLKDSQPLTENKYVNQLDIEELDDQLIKLIPKK